MPPLTALDQEKKIEKKKFSLFLKKKNFFFLTPSRFSAQEEKANSIAAILT